MRHPNLLAVCGFKNSGKTTLIEALIPRLQKQGLSVAVVKHDTHCIEVDRPGKDSDRFFQAGADVVLQGPGEEIFRKHEEGSLEDLLARTVPLYDLILVEGHKGTPLPKVWLKGEGNEQRPDQLENVLLELEWKENRTNAMMDLLQERLFAQYQETPLYGCVLIGGKSRRMGEPKHLIRTEGATWLERTVKMLRKATAEVLIAGEGEMPDGLRGEVRLHDVPDAEGPMAGVLAAMRWHPNASWLVAACDLPEASAEALQWLLSMRRPGAWIVMPKVLEESKEVQPLLAWYDFRSRFLLERAARSGAFSLLRLADHDRVITPEPSKEIRGAWKNINTKDDLHTYTKKLNSDD